MARYEPFIRREVRMRLTDPRLFRLFDSGDICQSVLLSFFVRAATGQYDLRQPRDLRNLLAAMARNKLLTRYRQVQRQPPAAAAPGGASPMLEMVVDQRPGAKQVVSARDFLAEVRERLTPEEKQLAELRSQDCSWPDVAARLGGTPDARRKQLARGLDRVLRELRLDEDA